MNKILTIIHFFLALNCNAEEFKLRKLYDYRSLEAYIFNSDLIVTEQGGKIFYLGLSEKSKEKLVIT